MNKQNSSIPFLLVGSVVYVITAFCSAEVKSIETLAKDLGSDDPAIRRKAEHDLAESNTVLEQLEKHQDPWTKARAAQLLMERRGIDTRIPQRLQRAVLDFEQLDEFRRDEVLQELTKGGPGHLNAFAFLYNRAMDRKMISKADFSLWQQHFQHCVIANHADAGTLRVESLSPATRAFLLACFSNRGREENSARYAKWRELDPSIRFHLSERCVDLEIDHLKQHADLTALLEYLPHILDPNAQQMAARQASVILAKDVDFKADGLGETAAIGHLMILMRDGGIHNAAPWYEKHSTRHPGIFPKLPPDLAPLEVNRLLKAGELSPAIQLALKPNPLPDRQARFDSNILREIANSLAKKPDSLPDGLPAIADAQSLPWMGRLLGDWFPMSRPSKGYDDIDAKVECFDRWAKTDEWLEAARRFGPLPLYHLVMVRRGKVSEILLTHEFEQESDGLKKFGALILMRPAIAKEIPARQCSEATLRHILDGGFADINPQSPLPGTFLDLATEWKVFHPDLLAPGSFPTQPLYQAALAWRQGELEKASSALLACAKPISIDSAPGQTTAPRTRPNPLASAAVMLLAHLLVENSEADFNRLLPPDQVSREILQSMLDRLGRMENRKLGHARAAMSIFALLRDRFEIKELAPMFSAHEARSFALNSWMAGEEKLTVDFLTQAYLSTPDAEEGYDSQIVSLINLLGRAEEALATLVKVKSSMPDSLYQSKRARLLRELGRTKEAVECMSPDHYPKFRLRLAIETGAWDKAILATSSLRDDTKMREARQACIAQLSGNKELMSRHTPGKHPVINLLVGNGIREDDLAEMARDAELLSRLEARLKSDLASGEPIRSHDMSQYFQYLDLLPDKKRAALLAVELAKRDTCVFSSPTSGEKFTGHKVLAAETLLLLGHGELAFGVMRPLMQASVEPHAFKGVESGVVSGGRITIVAVAYRQATRLAHFEWPGETAAGRMDRLAAILDHKDPLHRARGMIGLISKHEAKLEKLDLLQALNLPFLDLAHAGEVPEDLRETSRALLQKREPNAHETRWLESQWTRVPWTDETRHRPGKGETSKKVTFTPEAGSNSDPKKPGFVIIDGLAAATKLQQQKNAEGARTLLRDITIRMLLDSDMLRQEVEWHRESIGPDGTRGARFGSRGFLTMLEYFVMFETPSDLIVGLINACANPWTNYSDDKRLLDAARIMSKAGDYPAALAFHRRYLIATIPAFGSEDVGLAGRREIAEMHRVRGIIAANEGDSSTAADAVLQLVQISPYLPENAEDIAASLAKRSDAETIKSCRAAIERFWRIRLLEIPESGTYAYWKDRWLSLFP